MKANNSSFLSVKLEIGIYLKFILVKKIFIIILAFFFISLFFFKNTHAQTGIDYGENFIVFEAEATSSPLTKWAVRKPGDPLYQKYVSTSTGVEPINDTYLQYTGPWLGGEDTELEYKFTCQKTANYRMLMRMHQPLLPGEKGDARNDVFVSLQGNYTSETTKPKSELEKKHKFWGRGVNKWGSCHKLEIGAHINATYGLIEGEEYTFTMSGRSGGTCIDYILFYEDGIVPEIQNNDDLATFFPANFRPGLGLVDPVGLSIDPTTLELREGASLQLNSVWEPTNALKDIEWSSSDTMVVTVDENGIVTARGVLGQTAIITATSKVIDSISATCEVSIVEWYAIPVEAIAITPETDTIAEGANLSLTATIFPIGADDQGLTWSSSDDQIATVDQEGNIKALASGTVVIKATSVTDTSIYGESTMVIAEFFAPTVSFDDDNKYLNTIFASGDTMMVTINYHAGTFNTVTDVKVMFRHLSSSWAVKKDYSAKLPAGIIGSTSGTITVPIDLAGVTPTNELASGDFYFLFTKFWYTNGQDADQGLNPIQVVAAEDNTSSSNNLVSSKSLSVYPNPANDFLIIKSTKEIQNAKIELFNINGQLVYSDQLSEEKRIETSVFNSGMYFLKIQDKDQINIQKVIIR